MLIDFMRDKSKSMPVVGSPAAVKGLRIWYCSFRTLLPISALSNVETLVIAGFPDASLDVLSPLEKLQTLRIVHLPMVTDLAPLANFRELRSLSLETLPSWDSSRKKTVVASLAPIASIPGLQHLSLFGVVPRDSELDPLKGCQKLQSARIQGYSKDAVADFFASTGVANAHNPTNAFE